MHKSTQNKLKRGLILALRICAVFFCGLTGYIHLWLGHDSYSQAGLKIFNPTLSGGLLIFVSIAHIHDIFQGFVCPDVFTRWCRKRSKKKKKKKKEKEANQQEKESQDKKKDVQLASEQPKPPSIVDKILAIFEYYMGVNGLFGEEGPYFEYFMIGFELMEVPGQTYQAYKLSQVVSGTNVPIYITLVVAWEAVMVPYILSLDMKDRRKQRSWAVLCDVWGDFCFGILFPIGLMIIPLLEYTPRNVNDLTWTTRVLASVKHLCVTDPLDLMLTCSPMVSMHLLLKSLSLLWFDKVEQDDHSKISPYTQKDDDVVQQPKTNAVDNNKNNHPLIHHHRWTRFWKPFRIIVGISWATMALSMAISAKFDPSCDALVAKGTCTSPIQPWLHDGGKCPCLIVHVDCEAQAPLDVERLFRSDLENDIRYLLISDCPDMKATPEALDVHDQLWYMDVIDCPNLTRWNAPLESNVDLILLTLTNVGLTEISEPLAKLPPSMYGITMANMTLTTFPESISQGWVHLREIEMVRCNLTSFPEPLTSLSMLTQLDFTENAISKIPSSIANLVELRALIMPGNQLTELPLELNNLPRLRGLVVAQNLLSSVENFLASYPRLETLDDLVGWAYIETGNSANPGGFITLAGNPLCNTNPKLATADVCAEDCAPLCDRALNKNTICDYMCNVEACGFDRGMCLFEEL